MDGETGRPGGLPRLPPPPEGAAGDVLRRESAAEAAASREAYLARLAARVERRDARPRTWCRELHAAAEEAHGGAARACADIAAAEAAVRAAEEAQAQEEEKEKKKATAGGHENNTTAAMAAREAVVHAWHWVLCRAARRDESCRVLEEIEDEDGDSGRRHAAYSEALQAIDEYTRELEDERRTLQTLVELALNDAPCYYVVAQECSEVTMPTFVDVFSCSPISLLSRLFSHVCIALFTATEGCSRRVRSTTCRWHTARLDGGSGRRRAAVPQRRWSLPTATTRGIVRSAPAACSLSAALPTRSSRCRSPPSAPLRASLPRRVHAPRSTLPTTPLSLSSCLLLLLLKTDFSSSPSLSFRHISLLFLKHQHHPHPFVQFVFR